MKELFERYQQFDAVKECKNTKITPEFYIRKFELKLKEMF